MALSKVKPIKQFLVSLHCTNWSKSGHFCLCELCCEIRQTVGDHAVQCSLPGSHLLWFLAAFEKLWKATISVVTSACLCPSSHMEQCGSPTGQIFIKSYIWGFFESLSRKFKFHWNLTRITRTLHGHLCTLSQYLPEFFLEWGMFQTNVIEKIQTHFITINFFTRKSCRLWDIVET